MTPIEQGGLLSPPNSESATNLQPAELVTDPETIAKLQKLVKVDRPDHTVLGLIQIPNHASYFLPGMLTNQGGDTSLQVEVKKYNNKDGKPTGAITVLDTPPVTMLVDGAYFFGGEPGRTFRSLELAGLLALPMADLRRILNQTDDGRVDIITYNRDITYNEVWAFGLRLQKLGDTIIVSNGALSKSCASDLRTPYKPASCFLVEKI